jgi:hypothetical protein
MSNGVGWIPGFSDLYMLVLGMEMRNCRSELFEF